MDYVEKSSEQDFMIKQQRIANNRTVNETYVMGNYLNLERLLEMQEPLNGNSVMPRKKVIMSMYLFMSNQILAEMKLAEG
jgi:riboflavin synthase alpha subunit